MAAPDYVPTDPTARVRTYSSPPRRPESWTGGRPGELSGTQPEGPGLGTTGPDQGYALKLSRPFRDRVHLGELDWDDVEAGCVAVAMKRAGLFGRAPVIHDLTAGFTVFGFLDADAPAELVELREELFPEVHSHHHYLERRHLVDLVDVEMLRKPHGLIADQYQSDWRSLLNQ